MIVNLAIIGCDITCMLWFIGGLLPAHVHYIHMCFDIQILIL